ncbi:MAG: hypothetical protein KGK07_05235 [Chloroflexota bacterium]|nr:hypothetical protein [Chloroflexota bacterium]
MPRTGPRTPRGRDAARLNGLTHGLASAELLTPGESRQDWCLLVDAVVRSLQPEPGIEAILAARVAELLWRIRRVARAEAGCVAVNHLGDERAALRRGWMEDNRRRLAQSGAHDPSSRADGADALRPDPPALLAAADDDAPVSGFYAPALAAAARFPDPLPPHVIPDAEYGGHIIRYEAHLSRQLYAALNQLEAIQARRSGHPAPLARLQVSGLPRT